MKRVRSFDHPVSAHVIENVYFQTHKYISNCTLYLQILYNFGEDKSNYNIF